MFDGYCGPNTHAAIVHLTSSHVFQGEEEHFLSNTKNKELLISLLRDALELNKCATEQVVGDADLSIVTTTLATVTSTRKPTVLVGDDTDLLILLWHHSLTRTNNVFFSAHNLRLVQNIHLIVGTLLNSRASWVKMYAATSYLCMMC